MTLRARMLKDQVTVLAERQLRTHLKTAKRSSWVPSPHPDHPAGLILLTDLLTTATDNPGCCWTSRQSATPRKQA